AQGLVLKRGEHGEADQHAHARSTEAPVPTHLLSKESGNELAEECANVDSHVEDGETRITTRTTFGVQIADNRGDVRLQQSGSQNDEDEPQEERQPAGGERGYADRNVSERNERGAVQDCAPKAEQPVGYPSTRQGCQVDTGSVNADDGCGLSSVKTEAAIEKRGRHEENEKRPQSIVGEALPHLREEQRRKALRMAEKAMIGHWRCAVGSHAHALSAGAIRFVSLCGHVLWERGGWLPVQPA